MPFWSVFAGANLDKQYKSVLLCVKDSFSAVLMGVSAAGQDINGSGNFSTGIGFGILPNLRRLRRVKREGEVSPVFPDSKSYAWWRRR